MTDAAAPADDRNAADNADPGEENAEDSVEESVKESVEESAKNGGDDAWQHLEPRAAMNVGDADRDGPAGDTGPHGKAPGPGGPSAVEPGQGNAPAAPEGRAPLNVRQLIGSVLAAGLGVQSSRNRERDFSAGRPVAFIICS